MVEIKGQYKGHKRNELCHGPSNEKIFTDAPKDNNGKGESFSPTDLLAAALGSCAMTIMAIWGEKNNVDLTGASFHIEKHMASEPRRVSLLKVKFLLPAQISAEARHSLEKAAWSCPVKLSLHENVQTDLIFSYEV